MLSSARIVLSLTFIALASPAIACPAEAFVVSAGKAFQAAARAGSASAFTSAASRFTDLRAMSLFALGPYRSKLSKAQEAQYFSLSRKFMGEFMAYYGARFSGHGVTIVSCNGNAIQAKFAGGKSVTFRLSKAGKGYRVQDVSISSVWLAQQLRAKFTGVIKKNGGDVGALLKFLQG